MAAMTKERFETGLTYDQYLLGTNGLSPKLSQSYDPSQDHVTAVTARSATAKGGIRGAALALVQAVFLDAKARRTHLLL